MPAITDVSIILQTLELEISTGDYSFSVVQNLSDIDVEKSFAVIKEREGYTIISEAAKNPVQGQDCVGGFKRITITVHTSLDSIGLTAVISGALAQNEISANVVAGFYHDHIFVRSEVAGLAAEIISGLKQKV